MRHNQILKTQNQLEHLWQNIHLCPLNCRNLSILLGLQRASDHLQELLANRMRNVLTKLTNKAYLGVFAGAVLTIMIQSSGAVTSMLVGLSAAGVIALREVMSVLLGASVGTTLTVQLLSFHITKFGLAILLYPLFLFFSQPDVE